MNPKLIQLLKEIELFGDANDLAVKDRSQKMLNITHDTGELLSVLINSINAKNILEIGTSNGYSTLWLAYAAEKINGKVITIDHSGYKISLASDNFSASGLQNHIQQIHGDAGLQLTVFADNEMDFIFLDSNRSDYVNWWPQLKRILRTGGLLVVDNATSHLEELAPFMEIVRADSDFITSLVPIGNGEFLASKF